MKIFKYQLIFFTIWIFIGLVLNEYGVKVYEDTVSYYSSVGLFGGYMVNMILFLIFEHREKKKVKNNG